MKYEICVEYPRKYHPKFDKWIISNAGIQPYNTAVSGRARSLEFAFDKKEDYERAYASLSKQKGIRVVAGNLK